MTQQDITKGDILIAKFMGWAIDNSFPDKGRVWRSPFNNLEMDTTLKFHLSWGALMSVVERIEELGYVSTIEKMNLDFPMHRVWFNEVGTFKEIAHGSREDTKFNAVYSAVVDFIQLWHNENTK